MEPGRDATGLVIAWPDGEEQGFGWSWLRDSCRCDSCVRPGTSQRLIDVRLLPRPLPEHTWARMEGDEVVVGWGPEGHVSRYPLAWLRTYAEGASGRSGPDPWGQAWDPRGSSVRFGALIDDDRVLATWMGELLRRGLAMITGAGPEPGVCEAVVARFGFVRETNYGRTFDVADVPSPANLAYTGLELGLHTDNPYRDPVPTLQLLHCRVAAETGGESLFADGLGAALALREEDPDSFALLAEEPVPWRYTDDHVDLTSAAPVIRTDQGGRPVGVRWNERCRQPLAGDPVRGERHFDALRRFGDVLSRPEGRIRLRLEPGEVVVFDNERVLHGRTAVEGGGRRLLTGCYADRDGLRSRLAVLSRP